MCSVIYNPTVLMISPPTIFLFFYLFFRVDVTLITCVLILGVWGVAATIDLAGTLIHQKYIQTHEKSIMLSCIYDKLQRAPMSMIGVISFTAELAFVLFVPCIIFFEWDVGASIAIAYLFAVLHVIAIHNNEKFLEEKLLEKKKIRGDAP